MLQERVTIEPDDQYPPGQESNDAGRRCRSAAGRQRESRPGGVRPRALQLGWAKPGLAVLLIPVLKRADASRSTLAQVALGWIGDEMMRTRGVLIMPRYGSRGQHLKYRKQEVQRVHLLPLIRQLHYENFW